MRDTRRRRVDGLQEIGDGRRSKRHQSDALACERQETTTMKSEWIAGQFLLPCSNNARTDYSPFLVVGRSNQLNFYFSASFVGILGWTVTDGVPEM